MENDATTEKASQETERYTAYMYIRAFIYHCPSLSLQFSVVCITISSPSWILVCVFGQITLGCSIPYCTIRIDMQLIFQVCDLEHTVCIC